MRKILALVFSLFACAAHAQIVGALPFTLQNGAIADANQVMSDLNTIVAGVNANAATAGINTNINALNALTTPLVYTSGGTANYIGGTSGGSANAQVIASPIPSGFTLTTGKSVTFAAGFTNNGPTQLNVASTGLTNVFKQTASGAVAMAGGEIVLGQVYTAVFDGTEYQIAGPSPQSSVLPCTVIDWTGANGGPSGYLLMNGQAVSRTTFAPLFNCIAVQAVAATTSSGSASVVVPNSALFQGGWFVSGNNVTCNSTVIAIPDGTHITISANAGASGATTLTIGPYNQGDCSTTFNVGNFAGRTTAMRDGVSVLTGTTCATAATIGQNCGTQTKTLLQSDLPNVNVAGVVTDPGHVHTLTPGLPIYSANTSAGGSNALNAGTTTTASATTGISVATRINGNVTQTLVNGLQPTALVDKYIKF